MTLNKGWKNDLEINLIETNALKGYLKNIFFSKSQLHTQNNK